MKDVTKTFLGQKHEKYDGAIEPLVESFYFFIFHESHVEIFFIFFIC